MQYFSPYTQYRDSGLPWLGQIPAHWEMRRNRFLFREVDRRSLHGEETHLSMSQVHGLVPSKLLSRKSLQSENYSGGKLVAERDLVLNRLKAHLDVFAIAKQDGVVSADYTVLHPNGIADVRYCELLFRTPTYIAEFRRRTKGIVEGFWRLYTDDFYNTQALLPPLAEQTKIAHYLRTQDAKIARFIRIKRELIQRLNEQKLRLIDHAVTGGLNTTAKRKPSGVAWLGEVPEHWDVSLLKHVADVCFSGVDKHSHPDETPVRLCNYTDVYKNDAITGDMELMHATATSAEIARLTLQAGDVILTKDSEAANDIGVPAWVPQNLPGVICGYHLALLRPQPQRISGEFLFRAITSIRGAQQFHVLANGVTRFALGKHDVKNAIIPVPPLQEQRTILAYITAHIAPLNTAITHAEQQIQLIREYRERLITDAVTGQIDLRGWQPGPDDSIGDADLSALADEAEASADPEEGDDEED